MASEQSAIELASIAVDFVSADPSATDQEAAFNPMDVVYDSLAALTRHEMTRNLPPRVSVYDVLQHVATVYAGPEKITPFANRDQTDIVFHPRHHVQIHQDR